MYFISMYSYSNVCVYECVLWKICGLFFYQVPSLLNQNPEFFFRKQLFQHKEDYIQDVSWYIIIF